MGDISATATGNKGNFEILVHTPDGVLINSGTGYDGYGNRLVKKERTYKLLSTVSGDWDEVVGTYAYLCIRMSTTPTLLDYQTHPVTNLPLATKKIYSPEFYLTEDTNVVEFPNGTTGRYPILNSDGVIDGLVLGKLFKPDTGVVPAAPVMTDIKSPFVSVKDGEYFPLAGFNLA